MSDRLDAIIERLGRIDGRLEAWERGVDARLRRIEANTDLIGNQMANTREEVVALGVRVARNERRISGIQQAIGDTTDRINVDALTDAEHRAQVRQTWRVIFYAAAALSGAAALAAAIYKVIT